MRLAEAIKQAKALGYDHGGFAGGWYFNRAELKRADYIRIHNGIQDGDPEVMDTIPSPYSDENFPRVLFDEIGVPPKQLDRWGEKADKVAQAFADAFRDAAEAEIVSYCLTMLKREVSFTFTVYADLQDADYLAQKMEDVLNRENCEVIEAEYDDEAEGT